MSHLIGDLIVAFLKPQWISIRSDAMSVPEQTPYKEYVANGVTSSFAMEFDCDRQDFLIVALNEIEAPTGSWYLSDNTVFFNSPPESGVIVSFKRNTPLERSTQYQTFDNTLKPAAINKDFDLIWWKLQELGLVDWILSNRINELKKYVDDRDDELRAYLLAEIQAQGVALDQLDDYYNYLMQRLAEIAVNGGWDSSFVSYGSFNQKKYNDGVESIAELLAIQNPINNMRIFVKSFYAGLNAGQGEFVFKSGISETEVPGFVMNVSGGVWKRSINSVHSIDDAGAHPTQTASVNANAINKILSFIKSVHVPSGDYVINPDVIKLNNKNTLFGEGCLVGISPNTLGIADGTGTYIEILNVDTAVIKGITLKNGYQSKAILCQGSKNIIFDEVVTDGFTYGIWIGENDTGDGCQNIMISKPKVLNTRYWGIYIRGLYITEDNNKTQNIQCVNPFFYNVNMAAFVCAEGNVKYVTLENPVFKRCNIPMHFEGTTNYVVINPRDYDSGKKPDHVPPNDEYPYIEWSMYHAFASHGKVIGGTLEKTCYHYAANGGGSEFIEYQGTTALDYVFEGGDGTDLNKVFFQNYFFNGCTAMGALIYQLAGADNFLRNFIVNNCTSFLGKSVEVGAGDGGLVSIYAPRTVNFKVNDCTIYNSCFRITGYGHMIISKNNFIGGTNNTQSQFDGVNGTQLSGSILEFTGNIFERAGGTVIGDSAFLITNFSRVRTDNTMRTTCNYGYRFTDNYRVEYGKSYVLGWTLGSYTQNGTVDFVSM